MSNDQKLQSNNSSFGFGTFREIDNDFDDWDEKDDEEVRVQAAHNYEITFLTKRRRCVRRSLLMLHKGSQVHCHILCENSPLFTPLEPLEYVSETSTHLSPIFYNVSTLYVSLTNRITTLLLMSVIFCSYENGTSSQRVAIRTIL